MKKEEALALGVPEERIREFQDIYNRDLRKAVKNDRDKQEGGTQTAIMHFVPLIKEEENLRKILKTVSHFYIMENPNEPQQEGENENKDIVCAG